MEDWFKDSSIEESLHSFLREPHEPSVSVRLNPAKPAPLDFVLGDKVPWCSDGYFLESRPLFTADPLFHAGAYYVQDSSAMFPGRVFEEILPSVKADGFLRVLDLCAAPGGKTTYLLSVLEKALPGQFLLTANEVENSRATILCDNVARWGSSSAVVTSVDPKAFSPLEGYYDIILADVPCSGEGMFWKDKKALEQWSPQTVDFCQARQRRILSDVWPALRTGGVLIYSTCTFNNKENDQNVSWIARTLGAEVIDLKISYPGIIDTKFGFVLVPGSVRGEGQYCAALVKTSPAGRRAAGKGTIGPKKDIQVYLPEPLAKDAPVMERLKPLRMGTAVGSYKGKDFIPHPDLALSGVLDKYGYERVELSLYLAQSYLRREAIALPDAPLGYLAVTYKGLPLGFVKNIGKRCNNLLPAGRRIRMEL